MIPKKSLPAFIDINAFAINKNCKISFKDFNERKIVIIDNFYENPLCVRNYILSVPSFLDSTGYPGWRSRTVVVNDQYKIFLKKILQLYFPEYHNNIVLNDEFIGGIISTSLIKDDRAFKTHIDGEGLAGIIYLNMPEECAGGTEFFNDSQTTIPALQINMTFNRLILYPMSLYHTGWLIEGSFDDYFRITQNIFHRTTDFLS